KSHERGLYRAIDCFGIDDSLVTTVYEANEHERLIIKKSAPRPSGTGNPFLFLSTGAEAPAYYRSASPDFANHVSRCTCRVRVKSAKHAQAFRPGKRGRGRPRHNVGRASPPVRLLETAWKMSELQSQT